MARDNHVTAIGVVVNEKLVPKTIAPEKTDGVNSQMVLNFRVKYWSDEDKRFYSIPVAVWGEKLVRSCIKHLKQNDLILVRGEIRFTKKRHEEGVRDYYTIKADTIEFIEKKLENEGKVLSEYEKRGWQYCEIDLLGNLVQDAEEKKGFVLAVDRKYVPGNTDIPNEKLTDYVTLIVADKKLMQRKLEKGSVVIVRGKLMTTTKIMDVYQKGENGYTTPRVVVGVDRIVGR